MVRVYKLRGVTYFLAKRCDDLLIASTFSSVFAFLDGPQSGTSTAKGLNMSTTIMKVV